MELFVKLLRILLLRFLILSVQFVNAAKTNTSSDVCGYCRYMVATFKEGLNKTDNQHFAGGNTDWEERKLGRFKTSETRFVEIWDHVCKKFDSNNSSQYDSLKDLQFKCNHLAEDSEELLEKWFFKRQDTDPDIFKYVCVDKLQKCCSVGRYGPNCSPCPGALKGLACFGHGKCIGDGIREGSGKCECSTGYAGVRCSNCDAHYFEMSKNDTHIECKACFDGCASGCSSELPTGCIACRSGYRMADELGCVDVDECLIMPSKCEKIHEKCINIPGQYNCECEDGYRRNIDTNECDIDVQETPTSADKHTNNDDKDNSEDNEVERNYNATSDDDNETQVNDEL